MLKLYTVIPCFNEEAVIQETSARLVQKYGHLIADARISADSKIVFVDDGSRDATWKIVENLHAGNTMLSGIKLSRNQGHQNALLAGLMAVRQEADVVISMDSDLQDDIDAMDEFLKQHELGCDIVYGVRKERKSDSFFKRFTAEFFYKLLRFMGAEVIFNHADYRLMSKRALESLSEFEEVNLFLRGIIPMLGYKTGTVLYVRHERFAGETKYPFKRMLDLALQSITSLSVKPIRVVSFLGMSISLVSLLFLIYIITGYFLGWTVAGWASLGVSIWFLGGLQLLAIGVIGEYVAKTYLETKHRPRYIIEKTLFQT